MSAHHTPGPWIADDGGSSHFGIYAEDDGRELAALFNKRGPFPQSSFCGTQYLYDGQHRANAMLMAAAPDLLAALLEILGPLNVCTDNGNVGDHVTLPVDMTMGELRKARDAITKATKAAHP